MDTKLNLKQNTLVNVPGTGETLLESGFIKRIFTVSPLEIKTYLNLHDTNFTRNSGKNAGAI